MTKLSTIFKIHVNYCRTKKTYLYQYIQASLQPQWDLVVTQWLSDNPTCNILYFQPIVQTTTKTIFCLFSIWRKAFLAHIKHKLKTFLAFSTNSVTIGWKTLCKIIGSTSHTYKYVFSREPSRSLTMLHNFFNTPSTKQVSFLCNLTY